MKPNKDAIKTLTDDLIKNGLRIKIAENMGVTSGYVSRLVRNNYEDDGPIFGYLKFMEAISAEMKHGENAESIEKAAIAYNSIDSEVQRHIKGWRGPTGKVSSQIIELQMVEISRKCADLSEAVYSKPKHEIRAAAVTLTSEVEELLRFIEAEDSRPVPAR